MKHQAFDLIGDIHGHFDKLEAVLRRLGYKRQGQGFRHEAGRKVIFLGDYIDRGPKIREVLWTVRAMLDSGDALAIQGNHEYNAVCYATPDGRGDYLRPHKPHHCKAHRATLDQFEGRQGEWQEWLEWMKQLPFFLDLGDLRAVHACWDARRIEELQGKSLGDDAFLHASADRASAEYQAIETVLKGPEMALPEGYYFLDKEGIQRKEVRVRWWGLPEQAPVHEMALPEPLKLPVEVPPSRLDQIPNYGVGEPPVFVGHYWLPAAREKAPLSHNIACLDFSAAKGGPLMAYRWEGERHLDAAKFVGSMQCH